MKTFEPERTLLWFLIWAVLITVFIIGQHSMKMEREYARLHAAVNASMVPPEVVIRREQK